MLNTKIGLNPPPPTTIFWNGSRPSKRLSLNVRLRSDPPPLTATLTLNPFPSGGGGGGQIFIESP